MGTTYAGFISIYGCVGGWRVVATLPMMGALGSPAPQGYRRREGGRFETGGGLLYPCPVRARSSVLFSQLN